MIGYVSVILLFFIFNALELAHAHPAHWVGTWTDPVWGGKIYICLITTTAGENYATASMSSIGFLYGQIDANNNYHGNYYIQGGAQTRGAFNFSLTDTNDEFNAVWKDAGNVKSYSHAATNYTRLSSDTPTDLECLRIDADWVAASETLYMTGTFEQKIPPSEHNQHISYDNGQYRRSSYDYDWDGSVLDGYIVGTKFENGLVSMEQWYEKTYMGIELSIFKNKTAFYVYWVLIDHPSEFDYSNLNGQPEGTVSYGTNIKILTSSVTTDYEEWHCFQLQVASEQESCLTTTTTVVSDDDIVSINTEKATYATLSFCVINFVLIIVIMIMKQNTRIVSVSGGTTVNEMTKV